MVWRVLFLGLFLGASVQAADLDAKKAYYGQDFFQSSGALKEKLFHVLAGSHQAVSGGYDQISPKCGGKCYRHEAIGYKRAREFLFGDFYLVKDGSEYGVKDVYCQRVAAASEFSGAKPGPNAIPDHRTINAEHSWPQSHFTKSFPNEEQKSDLHHLFPTDSEMNSSRSSFDFGDVVAGAEDLKCSTARLGQSRNGNRVFEPPMQHKGNVARAIFYFSTRYKMQVGSEEEATLREWNRLDPVDAEERERNERIFELQKNRNPFVDYPELVEQVADF